MFSLPLGPMAGKKLEIKSDRLTNYSHNPFNKLAGKKEDLTRGLSYNGLKVAEIGTYKKVIAWYHEGKPDFYLSRKPSNIKGYSLVIQYQEKLDITLIGLF